MVFKDTSFLSIHLSLQSLPLVLIEVMAHWESWNQVRTILKQRLVAKDQDPINTVHLVSPGPN